MIGFRKILICQYILIAGKRKITIGSLYDPLGVKPSAVDVYARIVLPVLFVSFQIIYWVTCLHSMPPVPGDTILLEDLRKTENNFYFRNHIYFLTLHHQQFI